MTRSLFYPCCGTTDLLTAMEGFAHLAAWEQGGAGAPRRHCEPLRYTAILPSERSYR